MIMRSRSEAPLRFLNLFQIRFPIGAIASIAHRVSGVLLLIALPLLVDVLERSLRSETEFDALRAAASSGWGTLLMAVAAWAAAHHVFAGIRHLLMDVGIGSGLKQARLSARVVLAAAPIIAFYVLFRGLW